VPWLQFKAANIGFAKGLEESLLLKKREIKKAFG
jgi:hypothetical protein